MALTEKDIQVIEDHILGRLTPEDTSHFERIESTPEVIEYMAEHGEVIRMIQSKGRKQLKSRLSQLEQGIQSSAKERVLPPRRRWVAIAASVALIAGALFILRPTHPSTDALYADYYRPYPNLIDPITKSDDQKGSKSPYQLYESRQYELAISELISMPSDYANEWYLALAYMGLGQIDDAQKHIDNILIKNDHEYRQPAQWYKALLLIKKGNIKEAKEQLQAIGIEEGHPYTDRADRLLTKM